MIYLQLFLSYLKIGFFGFGGGYAMLSLIQNEIVEQRGWLTATQFADIVAVSQITPGPIAINSATYIGYKRGGVLGAIFSTLGVVLPSFIIIFTISLFLDAVLTFELVQYAFRGIQACVVYLILSAGIKMLKGLKKTKMSVVILVTVTLLMVLFSFLAINFSTIIFIIICGCIGLAVDFVGKNRAKEERK